MQLHQKLFVLFYRKASKKDKNGKVPMNGQD